MLQILNLRKNNLALTWEDELGNTVSPEYIILSGLTLILHGPEEIIPNLIAPLTIKERSNPNKPAKDILSKSTNGFVVRIRELTSEVLKNSEVLQDYIDKTLK